MFPGALPPDNRLPPPPPAPVVAPAPAAAPVPPVPAPPPEPKPECRPPTVESLRERLNAPPASVAPVRGTLLTLASLALFVAYLSGNPTQTVCILVGVLFIHEMGHLIGMWLFGYRDMRLFFVPFFGAVITSRNETAEPWQRAAVLLLGPLPGIFAGLALFLGTQPAEGTFRYELALVSILLNGFNLLPLVPLDGGRVLEELLLTRLPVLAALFQVLAAAGLAWIAHETGGIVFWFLFGFILAVIPMVYRQDVAAIKLRADHPDLPTEANHMSDAQLHDLIRAIYRIIPSLKTERYANWARILHGKARTPRARPAEVVLFFGLYALGIGAVVLFYFANAAR